MDLETLQAIALSIGGPFGGAFLAIRYALKSMNAKIEGNRDLLMSTRKRLNIHGERLDVYGNRITRVETRLDLS